MFHNNIVTALIDSMNLHIICNKHKPFKRKAIPGWSSELDVARENSLLWHCIWMECNRPEDGTVYNIMKKCRSTYHYMLRSLKKKKQSEIKVLVSKRILKTRNTDY